MISAWLQRVGSSVPRGFSRYFILELLKTGPHTGKEIIDHAERQSEGMWKPSPGLIYPLLGRLLDEGLIKEEEGGRYQITQKGADTAEDIGRINDVVKKQLDVLLRVGSVGRFVAMDLLERIATMGSILSSNAANMTRQETQKYRRFLESELGRLDSARDPKRDIRID